MKLRMLLILSGCACVLVAGLTACVSKSEARRRARTAYLEGQQAGMERALQNRGPSVTLVGNVKNRVLPWTLDLSLSKALLAAEYYGTEPAEIVILRDGQQMQVDPATLLKGEDVPLQPRDVIEIKDRPGGISR